jgi:hypothetical protein
MSESWTEAEVAKRGVIRRQKMKSGDVQLVGQKEKGAILMSEFLKSPANPIGVFGPLDCVGCSQKATHAAEVTLRSKSGQPTEVVVGWCAKHYRDAETMVLAVKDPCSVCRADLCDGTWCFDGEGESPVDDWDQGPATSQPANGDSRP